MTNNHREIFEELPLPTGLKAKVFERVETALERKNRNRKIIGFSLFSVSLLSCIYFAIAMIRAFQESSFSTYSSLIFSDSKLVLANFGDFMLSLVDSLPFFAITITLACALVVLMSVKYVTNGRKELSYTF